MGGVGGIGLGGVALAEDATETSAKNSRTLAASVFFKMSISLFVEEVAAEQPLSPLWCKMSAVCDPAILWGHMSPIWVPISRYTCFRIV